jgi:hypothetical protein
MGFFSRFFKRDAQVPSHVDVPLPILVHSHPRTAVPPGELEKGMVALEVDDVVLHAVTGILLPDGTLGDLPEDRIDWARRLSYRHLKREGCLADYGIPVIPEYDAEEPG